MTTERNIIIHAGQTFELSLDYAGTPGRGQRMHIRAADEASTVIAILTHNGDANARVIYDGSNSIDVTIGASVSGEWLVGANRVEWVYDIEDYDLSDADDVVITHRGKVIVYGNRTRPEDVTPSAALPSGDGRYVRFDGVQGLTDAQKLQARENIGAGTGGGGGSGDVVGPTSATDDRIAAFDGTTGKLIKQGTVTATAVASHLSSTSNPHSVTAAQVGADPAGTAASAVSTHAGAADPHGDRAYADGLAANYATAAQGALADSAVQDIAAEIHAATADAIADADEQGFWQSASSALRKITWSNIKATLKTYFDTLYAAITHNHAASAIDSGTLDAARLPAGTTSAAGALELATVAEAQAGTDTARAVTPEGVAAAIAALGGGASSVDIQEFTSSGTWTKPTNAKRVTAYLVGGGGGGASGCSNGATSQRGGAGGGAGRVLKFEFFASALSSTESVTVGAGGTAGAGAANNAFGVSGGNGGTSSFAGASAPGGAGASNGGTGGAGGGSFAHGSYPWFQDADATSAGGTATTSSAATGGDVSDNIMCTGGGAGGWISAGGAANGGARGGTVSTVRGIFADVTGGAGGAAGTAGTAGASKYTVGSGGGGGGASITGAGGAGGAGGFPGGGGGGGGAALSGGALSGAGGVGGAGYVVVVTECTA